MSDLTTKIHKRKDGVKSYEIKIDGNFYDVVGIKNKRIISFYKERGREGGYIFPPSYKMTKGTQLRELSSIVNDYRTFDYKTVTDFIMDICKEIKYINFNAVLRMALKDARSYLQRNIDNLDQRVSHLEKEKRSARRKLQKLN